MRNLEARYYVDPGLFERERATIFHRAWNYVGPATAGILTGSLVVERMFAIPGMGSHFIEAAFARDYTLAMGMVLVYTVLLVTMNTLVDLSYAVIDPRVKIQ